MTGKGWATGSDIITKPSSKEYREGWERIFGKDKENQGVDDLCGGMPPRIDNEMKIGNED